MEHDASTWEVGDDIVVASTDFNWEQAERFKVVAIAEGGKKLDVRGEVKYHHNGEDYEGVRMRAEVALLTRTVKIRGEMDVRKTE